MPNGSTIGLIEVSENLTTEDQAFHGIFIRFGSLWGKQLQCIHCMRVNLDHLRAVTIYKRGPESFYVLKVMNNLLDEVGESQGVSRRGTNFITFHRHDLIQGPEAHPIPEPRYRK